jgi:hypothetical protein
MVCVSFSSRTPQSRPWAYAQWPKTDFSFWAIGRGGNLSFFAVFAIKNLWHVVKVSEERTLNNTASEYEALKKMYPEKVQTLPQSMVRMNASGAVIPQNAPINYSRDK